MAPEFLGQAVMTIGGDKGRPVDLSIIIVNWNSKDYLLKAVAAIEARTKALELEILVIDSGSFDGCDTLLRQLHPHVLFIQSEANIGFARANNEAFKVSRGRNVLFLNPDTEVEDSAIETLYRQLHSLPGAGIVGARLLNSDGSVQDTCIRAFPTVLNQILDSNLLRRLFPKAGLWGMKPLTARNEAPQAVDAVSGACMMMRRALFETVGMFSTDYFMYSEDIDLCHKVRQAGFNTYYVPAAVIVHHGGKSSSLTSVSSFSAVMMLESRWRFFRKTRSLRYAWIYRIAMLGASLARISLALAVWPALRLFGKESRSEAVLKKWMAKFRWAAGGERWVKEY
jgi:N-acetylglucosaminyl-diphospho-decaprenol L-rhamnosyltransferase